MTDRDDMERQNPDSDEAGLERVEMWRVGDGQEAILFATPEDAKRHIRQNALRGRVEAYADAKLPDAIPRVRTRLVNEILAWEEHALKEGIQR